ncbi:MAG: phosphoribosyltransferase family protein, partial [Pseudomonadota bacterium]
MKDQLPFEKGFHVSWEQMHRDSRALAWRLDKGGPLEDGAWKAVVAITRGGMVPACIVARELDVRTVDTISVKSYDHQTQSEAHVLKSPDAAIVGDGEGVSVNSAIAVCVRSSAACVCASAVVEPMIATFVSEMAVAVRS